MAMLSSLSEIFSSKARFAKSLREIVSIPFPRTPHCEVVVKLERLVVPL